jgi:DNA-binding winged helix-turn-helix (wHTH) protein
VTREAALVLEFADYAFERDQGLRRRGEAVGLPPKVAVALALLVERRGALVTRNELAAAVWGEAGASDDSIARCLYQLRRLVPLPDGRALIRTVHGSGFRLAVPVRERRAGASSSAHKLIGGAPTAEPFEMLQQARELLGMMMAPEVDAALVAVERINVRWPEYAPAWSFRADLHMLRAMRWFGAPRVNGAHARIAAERALALDPEYAPAWAVRGVVDALIERDTAGGLADLERAIALDPGYFMARGYHALALISAGRPDEAREEARDALARNSLSSRMQLWYPWTLFCTGAAEEALAHLESAIDGPFAVDGLKFALAVTAAYLGRHARALEVAHEAEPRWRSQPSLMTGYAYVTACAGNMREAQRALAELRPLEGVSVAPSALAPVHVALGQRDEAKASVARAYELGDPFASHMPHDPRLAALRLPKRPRTPPPASSGGSR